MGKITMQMDIKQKTLLILTIAAFGYLGYEIYGLMKSDIRSDSSTVAHRNIVSNSRGSLVTANAAEIPAIALNKNATDKAVPQPATLHHAPLATEQKAYLDMVNQYELIKMKRRLLEEKAAIAEAEHRIATLNKQTKEIDASLPDTLNTKGDTTSQRNNVFQLSSVNHQDGNRSAILNRSSRYYQVHDGRELANGSKIIDRSGVILQKGNSRKRITFDGVAAVPQQTASVTFNKKLVNLVARARNALVEGDVLANKIATPTSDHSANIVETNILQSATEKPAVEKKHDIVVAKNAEKLKGLKPNVAPIQAIARRAGTHYTEDERRILAMPKSTYTIQLMGSYHRDIVENFVIANDLGNRAMQFYVLNRGKRWYVLLYGNYPTQQAAQKALKALSPDLKKAISPACGGVRAPEVPWVRSVTIVQRDIRNHRHK